MCAFPNFRKVCVGQLTDSSISAAVQKCTELSCLDVGFCKLTDISILEVAKNCTMLQGFNVLGCTLLTKEAFIILVRCNL